MKFEISFKLYDGNTRLIFSNVTMSNYIGCLKGIVRVYHHVACDCISSLGAATVCNNKTTDACKDFGENHLVKIFAPIKIDE